MTSSLALQKGKQQPLSVQKFLHNYAIMRANFVFL